MQGADKGRAGELAGDGLRIGIVRARFNDPSPPAGRRLPGRTGRLDVDDATSRHVTVPGALECRWR
jgi:6,7-dimethyl-8-ribityllumazine synthase